MRIRTVPDLAAAVRQCRRRRKWSQAQLATEAGVGRDWVIQFEKGKSTVELGFVLRALEALRLPLHVESEREIEQGTSIPREVPAPLEHAHQLPTNLL